MKKKFMASTKIVLLVCTLVVLCMGAVPQPVDAARGDITIFCSGSDLCAVYEDPDVIIEFWLGRAVGIFIEL